MIIAILAIPDCIVQGRIVDTHDAADIHDDGIHGDDDDHDVGAYEAIWRADQQPTEVPIPGCHHVLHHQTYSSFHGDLQLGRQRMPTESKGKVQPVCGKMPF
ncbi:hypothetical protein CDAR_371391 [Caerostris darwini]|uniref:Secreted protein n=1 Tax=Caerostris darwini TaxID=1538125 RepID=A0AAV4U4S8_9ARAC|nr:hypothetical protein CDAR_371301 [Caerostris darwini]GIY52762.1 hypothetical protein CDAR_371391 [Caerostris darwini]